MKYELEDYAMEAMKCLLTGRKNYEFYHSLAGNTPDDVSGEDMYRKYVAEDAFAIAKQMLSQAQKELDIIKKEEAILAKQKKLNITTTC